MQSVLIVDDDKPVRDGLCSFVRTRGIPAESVDSNEALLRLKNSSSLGAVVFGYRLLDAAVCQLADAVETNLAALPVFRVAADLPVDVFLSRLRTADSATTQSTRQPQMSVN